MCFYALFPRYIHVTRRKRRESTHLRFEGLVLRFGRFDAENVQLVTSCSLALDLGELTLLTRNGVLDKGDGCAGKWAGSPVVGCSRRRGQAQEAVAGRRPYSSEASERSVPCFVPCCPAVVFHSKLVCHRTEVLTEVKSACRGHCVLAVLDHS